MSRLRLMISTLTITLATTTTVLQGAVIDYTWLGGTDTNWSNTANWQGGNLPPVNGSNRLVETHTWPDYTRIVFAAASMPTTNVPGWGDGWTTIPTLSLLSGGELNMAITSNENSLRTQGWQSPPQKLVVGDGNGAAGSATFKTANSMYLARDGAPLDIYVTVYQDGVLDIGGSLTFAWDSGRRGHLRVDGGTLTVGGNLGRLRTGSTFRITNDGEVTISGTVLNDGLFETFIRWDGFGSFTADFGGRYSNLAGVQAAIGIDFRLEPTFATTLTPKQVFGASDNGNGTFTVGIVTIPEPSGLVLLSALALALPRRRHRKA